MELKKERRFYRVKKGKSVCGVCAGLARLLEVDAWIIRLLWVASVLFFGFGIWFYFLGVIAAPYIDEVAEYNQPKILGVCYRISKKLSIDLALFRWLALITLVLSIGFVLLFYFIAYFVVTDEDEAGKDEKLAIAADSGITIKEKEPVKTPKEPIDPPL